MAMLQNATDIIAAIATANHSAGIGIIRLSGLKILPLIHFLFPDFQPKPRTAHLKQLMDADGSFIDQVILLYFPSPHSYTGEDVLEIQAHGGKGVLQRILKRCLMYTSADNAIRIAEPGEFTKRAFLNKKMDLTAVEAVADLINAQSEAAARSAAYSLSGAFALEIEDLASKVLYLRMLVEATLDFPEEDIEFIETYQAKEQLLAIRTVVERLWKRAEQGALLKNGARVVLVGYPNVGKSSLLNQLAGDDVAIVTDIAGTTRDRIKETIHIAGVPIEFIDTAGLRETDDPVEKIGIDRTIQSIAEAHLILVLQDPQQDWIDQKSVFFQYMPEHIPMIQVINKIDQCSSPIQTTEMGLQNRVLDTLKISAKHGDGIDALKQTILHYVGWVNDQEETPFLARERHLVAIQQALVHIESAIDHAFASVVSLDLFAEELRLAHLSIMEITGQMTSDDLLGVIFGQFCIGK